MDACTDKLKGKQNKEHNLMILAIILCILVFVITLIRAIITSISYDEAYTYLYISRRNLLDPSVLGSLYGGANCIANNHWLNSFLIFLFDRVTGESYNEFIIRMPSIISFAIFLYLSCFGYKKKYYSFTTFVFLIGNYYLNEFYGLARGYGMANTCVFGMCLAYIAWRKTGYQKVRYLCVLMISAVLAGFSNTIILMLYPAIGCLCLYRIIKEKQIKQVFVRSSFVIALFALCTVIQLIYHLNISQSGKPLYTGDSGFFDSFIKGYVNMFASDPTTTVLSIIMIVTSVGCLALLRKKLFGLDFVMMLILFVITNLLMQLVLQKGYATGRALLPFYSFIVIAMSELLKAATSELSGRLIIGKAVACICLCVSICTVYITRVNIHYTTEWSSSYKYRDLELGRHMTGIDYYEGLAMPDQDFYERKYSEVIDKYEKYIDRQQH